MMDGSQAFATRIMKPRLSWHQDPMDYSPRKSLLIDWEEVPGREPRSSSDCTPERSEMESTRENNPPRETDRPEEKSLDALFRVEVRPGGGKDYICFCGHISKRLQGWKVHYSRKHRRDQIGELRRIGVQGQGMEGHVGAK